jgi:Tfp pilus assembly protein PilW
VNLGRVRARMVRDGSESGVSLVELLVAMAITLLMLALISRMFAQVMRATSENQSTRAATGIAATVMDEITRVVRQGTQVATSSTVTEGAVLQGSNGTSLSIDTYVDAAVAAGQATIAPMRVTFTVDAAGNVVEQRYSSVMTTGYAVFAGSATSTRVVNGPVLTTASPAMFTYSDGSGTAVVPGATGLSSTQAATVATVTVTITVANSLATGPSPVQLTNQVTMPNIAIVNGGY